MSANPAEAIVITCTVEDFQVCRVSSAKRVDVGKSIFCVGVKYKMELYPKHEKSKDQNRIKSGSSKNKTSVVDVVDKTDCRADGPVQTQLGSLQLQDYAAVAVHNAASVDQVSDFVNEEEVTVVANPTDIDGDTEDMENPAPQAPGWKFYPDPSHDSLEDEEYAHREDNLFLNELEQENKSYDRDIEQSTIDMGEDENTQSEVKIDLIGVSATICK